MRTETDRPYTAPNPADRSPLAVLIQAVGDLKVTGYSASEIDGLLYSWNTDPESLKYLETHAHDAKTAISEGIAGIGNLLYIAANNDDYGNIDRETLSQTGVLLKYLAESLGPLNELEYTLRRSKEGAKAKAGDGNGKTKP